MYKLDLNYIIASVDVPHNNISFIDVKCDMLIYKMNRLMFKMIVLARADQNPTV